MNVKFIGAVLGREIQDKGEYKHITKATTICLLQNLIHNDKFLYFSFCALPSYKTFSVKIYFKNKQN